MAVTRQTMTPVSMNQFAFTGGGTAPLGAVAPSPGCDYAGGNTAFTSWATTPESVGGTITVLGIQYVNNGSQFLWYYNGATATTAYILIGVKAGGISQLYTQYSIVLGTTSYGYLGPFSPASFNQQDGSQFAGDGGGTAPGGLITPATGASGVGLTCIDFLNTTTLAVRLYQMGTVTP